MTGTPQGLPGQGQRESREGNWLLSLESERLLLNSDFPSQPSRERVRLGNVSSKQVLLKPLGSIPFLQEPEQQLLLRGVNPFPAKESSQAGDSPGFWNAGPPRAGGPRSRELWLESLPSSLVKPKRHNCILLTLIPLAVSLIGPGMAPFPALPLEAEGSSTAGAGQESPLRVVRAWQPPAGWRRVPQCPTPVPPRKSRGEAGTPRSSWAGKPREAGQAGILAEESLREAPSSGCFYG